MRFRQSSRRPASAFRTRRPSPIRRHPFDLRLPHSLALDLLIIFRSPCTEISFSVLHLNLNLSRASYPQLLRFEWGTQSSVGVSRILAISSRASKHLLDFWPNPNSHTSLLSYLAISVAGESNVVAKSKSTRARMAQSAVPTSTRTVS